MKYTSVLMTASIGLLAACSGFNEIDLEEQSVLNDEELVERVIFEAPVIQFLGEDDDTRASLSQEGEGGIRFAWEATDTVGIYPNKGAQVYFEMADGVGTNVASFDGGGWALRKGSTYSCYYPFVCDMKLNRDAIPVSFSHQEQTGVSNHNGVKFYLASAGTSSDTGALRFSFQMLNTVIRIKAIGLPAGTYTKLSLTTDEPLFVQEGTFGLEDMAITGKTYSNTLEIALNDVTLTEESTEANPFLVYLTSAPVDLRGHSVTVRVYSEDGSTYRCVKTPPSKAYVAGAWGGLKCPMELESFIIEFADPETKRICVEHWDTDGDGELSSDEAAAVTSLESYFSFSSISSFDELQYFTGLTSIVSRAFQGCYSLAHVSIPKNVTKIDSEAFYACHSLSEIILPESITSLGNYAFCYSGLSHITIPESMTSFGNNPFAGCGSLMSFSGQFASSDGMYLMDESTIIAAAFGSINGDLTIPDGVTSIGSRAFELCSSVTSINLPEGITSIGFAAFHECSSLTSISFPESLMSIQSAAFYRCLNITNIIIPEAVTSIGKGAFSNCSNLTSITVLAPTPPSGGDQMFDGSDCPIYVPFISVDAYKTADRWNSYSERIQALPKPNNIIYYTSSDSDIINPNHSYAFGANLVSNTYIGDWGVMKFDGDVTNIGNTVFWSCERLTSIYLPNSVTHIEFAAFLQCSGLTLISIPDGLTDIDGSVFQDCTALTTVNIPTGLPIINSSLFYGCSALTTVAIPNSVTEILDFAFYNCSGLTSIEIPDNVTSIGRYAFYNCSGLTSINIPYGVTSIEEYTFRDCSGLSSITIPESVTSIGDYAFRGCSGLTSISVLSTTPPSLVTNALNSTNNCRIYVPSDSIEAYKSAEGWSTYADRIFGSQGGEVPDIPGEEE